MKNNRFTLLVFILVFLSACTASPIHSPSTQNSASQSADIIFTNGIILTMDKVNPTAEAIAMKGNEILGIGTSEHVLQLSGPKTRIIDLQGRVLMPGFVDAHNHLGRLTQGSAEKFQQMQQQAIQGGITTTTEMGVDSTVLAYLKSFEDAGLMRMRWNTYLSYNDSCGDLAPTGWYKTYKQGQQITLHIRNQGVKIFTDGGACNVPAVSFEYPGGYGQGDLYMTQDQLTAVVREVQDAGYQAAIHALGDRAIEETQNAIAAALNGAPNTWRHRIEHNAVLRPDLLARYGEIGIIPVIFGEYPTCARNSPNSHYLYAVPTSYGTWEWPWRALLDANPGIQAAWHSDYPLVGSISAMLNLYGFVTRNQVAPDGSICHAPDWLKQGAISVDEALHIMTINSAYAIFRENEIGSLVAGKLADMVILSDNPMQVQPEAIKDISVLMTMIDGKVEYCATGSESLCPVPVSSGPASGSITASASTSQSDHPASAAIDGSTDTWWSAGSDPQQWIQLDMGQVQTISSIRLVVSQYPGGDTDHQIWAGPDESNLVLIHEFSGSTMDNDVLQFLPASPLTNIRFIRIITLQSPSWVAWREISINP